MLRWKDPVRSPEADPLTEYELSIFSPNDECTRCDPILLDSVEIQLEESSTLKTDGVNRDHLYIFSDHGIQKQMNSERSYSVLSYRNSKGRISPPSKPLFPRKPLKIPLPVILSVEPIAAIGQVAGSIAQATDPEETLVANQDHCNDKDGRLGKATACPTEKGVATNQDLVIQWRPVLETIQQILGKSGEIHERIKNYGLNFYMVNDDGVESLINLQPLVQDSIRFSYKGGKMIGRHVDRYGNESLLIQVYTKVR